MERITVLDKKFVRYIKAKEIDAAVEKLAERLNGDYSDADCPMFVVVMTGAFVFMADLIRKVKFDCEVTAITLESYGDNMSSCGNVKVVNGLNKDVTGRNVIIVDEIVDKGHTLSRIHQLFLDKGALSVRSAILIDKPHFHTDIIRVDYAAIIMNEDNFLVGYGLDYASHARGYKDIYILE